jgi:glutathione S-transferase
MPNFYWISGSGPCWKIALILEHYNIPYNSLRLDNAKQEQKSQHYLTINPRGQVPLWEDGDFILTQSNAIVQFIDLKFLDGKIFGKTPEQVAKNIKFCQDLDEFTGTTLQKFIRPIFRNKVAENTSVLPELVEQAFHELLFLENNCKPGEWLTDQEITIADFSFLPIWERFVRAVNKLGDNELNISMERVGDVLPNLISWHIRMKGLSGFDDAYPPHWKSS